MTTEARLARLGYEEAVEVARQSGVPDYLARLSIFQVLLRHPTFAKRFSEFLGLLLFENTLDSRLRELIIMRVGWTTGSDYEWTQHWAVAKALGVSEADLLAVRNWKENDDFGPQERAVLAATDEMVDTGTLSEATWSQLERTVGGGERGDKALIEVLGSIGGWRMVSSWLRALEVPLEDGVNGWPPDGAGPYNES